jgi:hypothetical protein
VRLRPVGSLRTSCHWSQEGLSRAKHRSCWRMASKLPQIPVEEIVSAVEPCLVYPADSAPAAPAIDFVTQNKRIALVII